LDDYGRVLGNPDPGSGGRRSAGAIEADDCASGEKQDAVNSFLKEYSCCKNKGSSIVAYCFARIVDMPVDVGPFYHDFVMHAHGNFARLARREQIDLSLAKRLLAAGDRSSMRAVFRAGHSVAGLSEYAVRLVQRATAGDSNLAPGIVRRLISDFVLPFSIDIDCLVDRLDELFECGTDLCYGVPFQAKRIKRVLRYFNAIRKQMNPRPIVAIESDNGASFASKFPKFAEFVLRRWGPLGSLLEWTDDILPDFPFVAFVPMLCSTLTKVNTLEARDRASVAIFIDRSRIYRTSREALLALSLKTPLLRVKFAGEPGIDEGGPAKEWCSLLSGAFVHKHPMLEPTPNRTSFRLRRSRIAVQEFTFLGRVIGALIRNCLPFSLPLSRSLLKQILGRPVTLDDLMLDDVQLYGSLRWVLENPVADAGLRFRDGSRAPVTDGNKREFVEQELAFVYVGEIEAKLQAFRAGVYDLVNINELQIFSVDELETVLTARKCISVRELKATTMVYGAIDKRALEQVRDELFRRLEAWSQTDLKRLLKFATGIADYLASFRCDAFVIRIVSGSDGMYPVGHTCSRTLEMPCYSTPDLMEARLREAILTDDFMRE
jgi:hypothetical protein